MLWNYHLKLKTESILINNIKVGMSGWQTSPQCVLSDQLPYPTEFDFSLFLLCALPKNQDFAPPLCYIYGTIQNIFDSQTFRQTCFSVQLIFVGKRPTPISNSKVNNANFSFLLLFYFLMSSLTEKKLESIQKFLHLFKISRCSYFDMLLSSQQ